MKHIILSDNANDDFRKNLEGAVLLLKQYFSDESEISSIDKMVVEVQENPKIVRYYEFNYELLKPRHFNVLRSSFFQEADRYVNIDKSFLKKYTKNNFPDFILSTVSPIFKGYYIISYPKYVRERS